MWYSFKPYVSVAQRKAKAARQISKLEAKGHKAKPVIVEGLKIARTFWGKAWCDNLESYSDFSNRLPRGRTYVRNGSVCDLQTEPGKVNALVCGSELYKVNITFDAARGECWEALKKECGHKIGAVVELLMGRFSDDVMKIITRPQSGLFPSPAEIKFDCSCPDWAGMCKHVAAVMYGIGARLDVQPELLFQLRQVDPADLVSSAMDLQLPTTGEQNRKTIEAADISDVFGIEMVSSDSPAAIQIPAKPSPGKKAKRPGTSEHGRTRSKPTADKAEATPVVSRKRKTKAATS